MFINFSDIPGHHNLFLDYLYEFDNVKQFYKYDFRNKENYLKVFKQISESKKENEKIAAIVDGQYQNLSSSSKTKENISLLSSNKTLAVVTGQQLGICGGPLYTLYKIITAIKLSSYLSGRYDDYKFVPVFWLEGDDHDFEEVRFIKIVDESNNLVTVKYEDEQPGDDSKQSVGFLKLTSAVNKFFEGLSSALKDSEFKEQQIEKIKSIYSEGKNYKDAFKELIFWLFDEYGLLIFDPQDKKAKQILKPVFTREVQNFRKHTEKAVSVSAKLEELYHAQVKVRPVNLFYHTDDGRYLIEPVENEFRLKGKRKKFTNEELLNEIEQQPERFSPNVILRPVCQDYLLPTAFYIAGPSEISYFAQVNPLYNFFNIAAPIIYPRSSVSIIEKNVANILAKYDLNIKDIFIDVEKVKENILKSVSETSLDDVFQKTQNEIEVSFDQLKEKLFELDKTTSDASTKYKQRIINYINELKGKALDAQKKKHEISLRQIDKAAALLFPDSNLQEREINFIYFINKYGMDILKQIFNEIEINKFEHQVIKL